MIENEDIVAIFICGQGRGAAPRCSCGAKATRACGFKLFGPATGKTCGKHVCDRCSEKGMCLPHARLFEKLKLARP